MRKWGWWHMPVNSVSPEVEAVRSQFQGSLRFMGCESGSKQQQQKIWRWKEKAKNESQRCKEMKGVKEEPRGPRRWHTWKWEKREWRQRQYLKKKNGWDTL